MPGKRKAKDKYYSVDSNSIECFFRARCYFIAFLALSVLFSDLRGGPSYEQALKDVAKDAR